MKMVDHFGLFITGIVALTVFINGFIVLQEIEHQMQPDKFCESKFGDEWNATENSTQQSEIYCVAQNGSVRKYGPINLSSELKQADEQVVDPWD